MKDDGSHIEHRAWENVLDLSVLAPPPWTSFAFAVITDPHCVETPASVRHGKGLEYVGDGLDRFRRGIEAIRAIDDHRPDFILLLGDIGLERAEELLTEAPCPVHPVAGNHEWGERRALLRALFPGDFGVGDSQADYYAFDHLGVRFVGICNAGTGNEHVGQLASEEIWPPGQSDWIERQLSSFEGLKVLFGHCPPEPLGFDRSSYLQQSGGRYLPLMGENDSRFIQRLHIGFAPVVSFFGHTHQGSSRETLGQSLVQVVRSACWNHGREPIGFLHVRIAPEAVYLREVITGAYRPDSA